MRARSSCRRPGCDRPPGTAEGTVRTGFCSPQCELRFEHVRSDVPESRRDRDAEPARQHRPP